MNAEDRRNINWYNAHYNQYESFAKKVEEILRTKIEKENLIVHSIGYRVKKSDSFLKKCQRKKYSNPEEQMTDFAGIRVIAYTESDVEKACKIVEDIFAVDWPNSPNKADLLGTDKVGYLSVHYIVSLGEERATLPEYSGMNNLKCEIQVRTLLQHAWAEIEHDREYKFYGQLPSEINRRFHLIAGTLELIDNEFQRLSDEIDEYTNTIKQEIKERQFKEIQINTVSLLEFLNSLFGDAFADRTLDIDDCALIQELTEFGVTTIEDLEELLTADLVKYIADACQNCEEISEMNYAFLLRSIMIMTDAEKYFNTVWNGDKWKYEKRSIVDFWEGYGANRELIEKHITIMN